MHIHRTGKTDERNSTCGALFPAVTISFGIELARSLSLSVSLCRFCGTFPSNNVICSRVFLAIILAITICCTRSPGQVIEPFPQMKGHECKMKGTCMQMKGRWKDMNAHWNENVRNKWKENEGTCMQMNAKCKEHEVLPKHLKPTKQLLDPFPNLFRILASCWISNMLISTKPWKPIGPPKSDNHNNSNYSHVKDSDGSSYGWCWKLVKWWLNPHRITSSRGCKAL